MGVNPPEPLAILTNEEIIRNELTERIGLYFFAKRTDDFAGARLELVHISAH